LNLLPQNKSVSSTPFAQSLFPSQILSRGIQERPLHENSPGGQTTGETTMEISNMCYAQYTIYCAWVRDCTCIYMWLFSHIWYAIKNEQKFHAEYTFGNGL